MEKGQILCIIEAMKIMNEIECECEGRFGNICRRREHSRIWAAFDVAREVSHV